MNSMTTPPQFPFGPCESPGDYDQVEKESLINQLRSYPDRLASEVDSLNDELLNTKYRNWTIRQIVHHVADSHINCYVRFKWTLTESTPTIKSYDETAWSQLVDARQTPIDSSLTMLRGTHSRWSELLLLMSDEDFQRSFFHPESQEHVTLKEALPNYVWHGNHHLAQIQWILNRR